MFLDELLREGVEGRVLVLVRGTLLPLLVACLLPVLPVETVPVFLLVVRETALPAEERVLEPLRVFSWVLLELLEPVRVFCLEVLPELLELLRVFCLELLLELLRLFCVEALPEGFEFLDKEPLFFVLVVPDERDEPLELVRVFCDELVELDEPLREDDLVFWASTGLSVMASMARTDKIVEVKRFMVAAFVC